MYYYSGDIPPTTPSPIGIKTATILHVIMLLLIYAARFSSFESAPITVVARELGSVVSRSILKNESSISSLTHQNNKPHRKVGGRGGKTNRKKTSSSAPSSSVFIDEAVVVKENANNTGCVEKGRYIDPLIKDNARMKESGEYTVEAEGTVGVVDTSTAVFDEEATPLTEGTTVLTPEFTESFPSASDGIFKASDVVYTNTKTYGPFFMFWQLMGWFNAGSDKLEEAPDLFGCAMLPEPEACFGRCESDYKDDRRRLLIELLRDDKKQILSWPSALKECFSPMSLEKHSCQEIDHLFGSPMLDVNLGQVGVVDKVCTIMMGNDASLYKKKTTGGESTQFDAILPPELPTAWVQCDACNK
jgi:hypothetical protein